MKKTKQREILAKWVNAAQQLEGRDGNTYLVLKPMGLGPEVEPMNPLPEQWRVYSSTVPNPDTQKSKDKE